VSCLQVIELDLEQLPDGDEVLTILRQEQAPLQNWVTLAVRYIMTFVSSALRYDTRCYFNLCSKADMSQLNLPHGNNN